MIELLIFQIIIATVVSLLWVRAIDKQITYSNKQIEEKTKEHVEDNND